MTVFGKKFTGWFREPLVHFLAIGALLFLIFHFWGDGGSGANRIVITPGQIDAFAAQFARTWQRPPTDQELKGLIDDYVREEMATREAMVMGLDRDDTIIRRRLRQKLEFMVEDTINAPPPTDTELQAWLDQHPQDYRIEPRIAFRQIYLNPERRGETLLADTQALLDHLSNKGPDIELETLGDAAMLPNERPLEPLREVARTFGRDFAQLLLSVEKGAWAGPVRSAFGLHIVFVRERTEAVTPNLDQVRPLVERDYLADRRKRELNAMYERMLKNYQVTMELRPEKNNTEAAGVTDTERGK